ncbi:MAG: hypothetical protein QM817_26810 [Archangium sp.]
MSMFRLALVALLLSSAIALAQPGAPSCYSPDRASSWAGPTTALGCHVCCGCRDMTLNMQWQVRGADAGWTGSEMIYMSPGRFSGLRAPFTHLESYCVRARFADGQGVGAWGPSTNVGDCGGPASDVCFEWDDAPPSIPTNVALSTNANRVIVTFNASSDDGGGIASYRLHFVDSIAQYGFGEAPSSPVTDVLGEGTWQVAVQALDRASNGSSRSVALPVTLGFDASVPIPAAPLWPAAAMNVEYVGITWADDAGADSWLVTQRRADGGWKIAARPHVPQPEALMEALGPCNVTAARVASVRGDQVSAWSAPSVDHLTDTVAPVMNSAPSVTADGGSVALTWLAATDGCPSGLTYSLQRSTNGGAFTTVAMTPALAFSEVLNAGTHVWRVLVEDGAGNQATSPPSTSVTIGVPVDAGQEEPDAGVIESDGGAVEPDAGVDAGIDERRELSVGCGCTTGFDAAWLLVLSAVVRRPRRAVGARAVSPPPSR